MTCRKGRFHSAWQRGFSDASSGRSMKPPRHPPKAGASWLNAWNEAYRSGWFAGKGMPTPQDRGRS